MTPTPSFLDELKAATEQTSKAEEEFRREVAERTKALADARAFAFRRLNLMRAIAEVVATAESEEIAVAAATAVLRAKLGWSNDSEIRDEVVSHFAPVAVAMFASLSPENAASVSANEDAPEPGVIDALTEFERWYAQKHSGPFWPLFENYMPETPVVDF
jgi:hypothetical protein